MDDLLQLMHDTKDPLIRIRSSIYFLRKKDISDEDREKLYNIIEDSEKEVRNKLDEYYKKVRDGV